MKKLLLSALSIGLLLSGLHAKADIVQTDFSDTSNWQLNGSAQNLTPNADGVLRLTNNTGQSASAFSLNTISLGLDVSFSAAFQFMISNPLGGDPYDGGPGADGLVFSLQTVSNTAGGGGGGIGYMGIANSVGIEFDNYFNSGSDINGNHVGINLNGDVNSVTSRAVGTDLVGSGLWTAWVDYNGVTDLLEVRLSNGNVRESASFLSYNVDLYSVFGGSNVYVGFTSGTGFVGAQHDVLNLEFNSSYQPIESAPSADVNAPAALSVLGLSLLLLGSSRKRKSTSV